VSLVQEYELLRRVPMFADIEPARLKLVAFMSERVGFDDGKLLCRQGDPGDAAYLIIEGEVEIVLEGPAGPLTVATIGANEIVAEMAILCDTTRNASVRAKGRVVALRISKEPFVRMVREFPAMAVSIMRELANRLDSTNTQLSAALSEVRRLREGWSPASTARCSNWGSATAVPTTICASCFPSATSMSARKRWRRIPTACRRPSG